MPNWYLGDRQNSVDAADLKGERVVPIGGAAASGERAAMSDPEKAEREGERV
ncbi:hypothetical protein C8Q79DRAFT_996536 [Trametes meyenii]|nr:hypothetical protein C8Q79DRAFT_996536 [Trametes meyenii]